MNEPDYTPVQKALGEPFAAEFSEPVRKMRNNLLVVSFVAIFAAIGKVHIDPHSEFFGMRFGGLSNKLILIGLLLTILYMLAHFIWCSIDYFQEWKLRLTGSRSVFIRAASFGNPHCDYPTDIRQSTLYNWWLAKAKEIGPLEKFIKSIEACVNKLHDENPNNRNPDPIKELYSKFIELMAVFQRYSDAVQAHRIPASLDRFDRCYRMMLTSQNMRWLTFELGLPIALGLAAAIILCCEIFLHQ